MPAGSQWVGAATRGQVGDGLADAPPTHTHSTRRPPPNPLPTRQALDIVFPGDQVLEEGARAALGPLVDPAEQLAVLAAGSGRPTLM